MTELSKPSASLAGPGGLGLRAGARVARHRRSSGSATASSSAASGSSRAPASVHDDRAARRGAARRGRAGGRRGRRRRGRRRARGVRDGWSALPRQRAREVPVPDRAHPPGALPRVRGARVAERRQADQGVARRRPAARRGALLLLRGLGRQARVRVPEPRAAAARRRRPDHPVELPAADAGLEARAGARRREHRRAQAGRDDAAHRAALLRRAPPGRAAAGRRQHRHRRRPHRAPRSSTPRSTRSRSRARPRSGRRSSAGSPAPARSSRSSSAARPRTSSSTTRARPGGRGDRQRHLLQPGPRLLRRLAALRAGVDRRAARRQAEAPHGDAARRRPARQEHRRRRDQLARSSSRRSRSSSPSGEEEGAEIYQPPCRLPEKGYWFAPTVFTNVAQSYRIAQEEIFGPVLGRSARSVDKYGPNIGYGRAVPVSAAEVCEGPEDQVSRDPVGGDHQPAALDRLLNQDLAVLSVAEPGRGARRRPWSGPRPGGGRGPRAGRPRGRPRRGEGRGAGRARARARSGRPSRPRSSPRPRRRARGGSAGRPRTRGGRPARAGRRRWPI